MWSLQQSVPPFQPLGIEIASLFSKCEVNNLYLVTLLLLLGYLNLSSRWFDVG